MNKMDLSKFTNGIRNSLTKHGPEILTGIGIAGMVTTTVLAVKVTPKALMIMQDAEHDKGDALTASEKVKACWKCYIPAAVTGATSIACLIGASSVHAKRNAVLATAYKLSETAYSEYKDKVIETIGEKKERVVKDKIAKDKIDRDPIENSEVIITEKGNTLCYDGLFGRYFKSDIDTIKRAMTEINRKIVVHMYASLNEFYRELNLSPVEIGDSLGWNIDDGTIEVDFSSQLAKDGTPCIVVEYNVAPKYQFSRFL